MAQGLRNMVLFVPKAVGIMPRRQARDDCLCVPNPLSALAARARDDLAEQLPRRAVKFLKLHLLDRSEIVRGSVDSDTGQ